MVTEVVGVDQNPRRESTERGESWIKPWVNIQEEKSYFHRSLRRLSRENTEGQSVVFTKARRKGCPQGYGVKKASRTAIRILLISARSEAVTLPAPKSMRTWISLGFTMEV